MEHLNEMEELAAKKIVNIGLARAAESFGSLTRSAVQLTSLDLQVKEKNELDLVSSKKGEEIHVLSTTIQGDLGGKCFLIFSDEEVERFKKANLPQNILNDPSKSKEMGEAMLSEADNIIAAAVITQFANILGVNIHGGVPELSVLPQEDVPPLVLKGSGEKGMVMNFNAGFDSKEGQIAPEFIWVMEDEFLSKIRAFSMSKKNMDELAELSK